MAGKWDRVKAAKAEVIDVAAEEAAGEEAVEGMIPATRRYEKRQERRSGKRPDKKPEKTGKKRGKATQTRAAKTSPLPRTGEAGAKSPVEPEEKATAKRPAEPEKKAAKQPPVEPERKPEPTKAPENGAKQPGEKAEVGSLVWFGQVDECISLLTKKTLGHDEVLSEHEQRIHKLERWKEMDDTFAKKAIPIISELQRDSELSDERLEELEGQFWSLWANHFGINAFDVADEEEAPAEDDDINTVDDLVGLEASSEAVVSKPKLDPSAIPSPAVEPAAKPVLAPEAKPVADVASGKPRRGYRYWDVETKSYWLTLDIWEAKAADDAYQPIWVWAMDDEIDHIMSSWEVRKYRPGTKADK